MLVFLGKCVVFCWALELNKKILEPAVRGAIDGVKQGRKEYTEEKAKRKG